MYNKSGCSVDNLYLQYISSSLSNSCSLLLPMCVCIYIYIDIDIY